jgi:tetratricopeptide (TPR) repeat protein
VLARIVSRLEPTRVTAFQTPRSGSVAEVLRRAEAGGDDRGVKFLVSYTASDRTWAEWIAWQLEDAGHSVVIQAWDFRPGSDFVATMREVTARSERTLAVLSAEYLRSDFGLSEWAAAYAADPSGREGKLLPVRVAEFPAEGLDRTRVWIDLVGLDEEEARQRLLDGVSQERAKPEFAPAFPHTRATISAPRFPLSLPPVWNLPHRPNPNFIGREELLAALAVPEPGTHTVLSQAITGLGGVGKTQVATEFAYRHRADYDVVWWVRAEEPMTLVQDLAALSGPLGLDPASELDAAAAAVRTWLESNDRWLVIFDNATDPASLEAVMPRGGDGRVLVTSQNPGWGGIGQVLAVDVLAQEDAVALLLRRSGHDDAEAANELARELGRLPLALEQAGAFVAESPGMTLSRYLQLFRGRAAEILSRGRAAGNAATVATTWELAFEAVKRASPGAAALLQVCAFLDPDDIPLGLIVSDAERWTKPLDAVADDPLALADALGHLGRFSLVTTAAGEAVAVHRLVQLVVRERMVEPERRSWAGGVAASVADAFPADSGDVRSWDRCALLLPHALAVTSHPGAADGDAATTTSWLLDRAATYLQGRARFRQARSLFERALAIDEATHGPDHPDVGTRLNNLAGVLRDLGDFAGARSLFERALAIDESAHGPNHRKLGTDCNNLAMVLQDLGDLARARSLYERALAIDEATHDPDDAVVGRDLNNLATVMQDMGDLAGARPLLERALAIAESAYDPNHPVVGTHLNNLAMVQLNMGDLAGARPLLERALAIAESAYDPDHPIVGVHLNNLALVLKDLGDVAGARRLLERAIGIAESAHGANHPTTQKIRRNLGSSS